MNEAGSSIGPMIVARRERLSLDGVWELVPDRERRFAPAELPAGVPISVPGPWEAQIPQPYGIVHAWYRRRFEVPDRWSSGTLVLRFGAAMARATVWLDGQRLGANEDGYLPFEVEAGRPRPGEHELVVAVANPINAVSEYPALDQAGRAGLDGLNGRPFESLPLGKQTWYTSTSGLLGSVAAELAPEARLAALVVLPDLDAGRTLVRWRVAGPAAGSSARVLLTVTSPDGRVVAEATADARAGRATVAIPSPQRWDLWQPALYRLDARLERERRLQRDDSRHDPDGPGVDEAAVRFGMRSIAVRDGAILLNSRPLYLRGALDQDFWPIGRSNPPSREALEEQVRLAREMGLNLLRCHLKVPDPAYLDVADEAGLLLWCELPNWNRFDVGAGRLGRRMLGRMVESMGSHPSIVAWTVINEDWGTDIRHEARDRRWLRATVDGLKALDPSRLVVDNSACEMADGGTNFHLRTDLADYHAYRSMPDGLPRWRALVEDFARRPAWLWSPHGDAAPTGEEALVLSEFGGWGLPRPSAVRDPSGGEPWWWTTGETFHRAAGIERRFAEQALDRIWPDADALAEATQWRQFDGLAAQIRELRRHPAIRGYVVTELSDAFWEPNGLLDVGRGRKAFHDRLTEINAPAVLIVDLARTDAWGGERVVAPVTVASFEDRAAGEQRPGGQRHGGRLDWRIDLPGAAPASGSAVFGPWPRFEAAVVGEVALEIPDVESVTLGELVVTATEEGGPAGAICRHELVVVPSALRHSAAPRRLEVVDPLELWSIGRRVEALGHAVVADDPDIVVTAQLDRRTVEDVNRGGVALVLARAAEAIPPGVGLARPARVRRRGPGDGSSTNDRPWDGDWTSVYAWSVPGFVAGLPHGGLLGDAQAEIFPDHVIDGLDVASPLDGVRVGMFAGWVHRPAALVAELDQGSGHVLLTTLRLAPESGPIATVLLESLVQRAAGLAVGAGRGASDRPERQLDGALFPSDPGRPLASSRPS